MIEYIWLNKGMSRETVSLSLSIEYIAEMAKNDNCTSVLIFHNHPNSDPAYYDCSLPSEQDISSAKLFAKELNSKGINLVEFICEKGIHHQYFSSAATVFFPIIEFFNEIKEVNGISKYQNFSLHMERF